MHDVPIEKSLAALRNRHIALVYQYLPPASATEAWYHTWGLSVMSFYGYGFESLGMRANYVDVETFIQSGRIGAQKPDYVLTLICGNLHVSNWALVPALAFWRQAISLPASADALIASERKDISSLFAREVGFTCPNEYSREELDELKDSIVVAKPRDYGSSKGLIVDSPAAVARVAAKFTTPYLFQQFVPGIDVTVAAIYDPLLGCYQFGKAIGYVSQRGDSRWMFDDQAKTQHRVGGSLHEVKKVFFDLPVAVAQKTVRLIEKLGGSSLARIDFRVAASDEAELSSVGLEAYSFLEINLCPTISTKSNFVASLRQAVDAGSVLASPHHQAFFAFFAAEVALNAFIAFSMVSYGEITSRYNALPGKGACGG